MTSYERVLKACAFQQPDRIPRFDTFWEYPESWRERLGPPEDLVDIAIWAPDETFFPTRKRVVKEEGGWIYEIDGWGRLTRRRPEAYFVETLEVPLAPGTDIDSVVFDPPEMDERYRMDCPDQTSLEAKLAEAKRRHCVFGKTGGPYLRTTYARGEEQFLLDIAGDPPLARALAEKVADHLIAVGCEQIRRYALQDTGIWIYDDIAHNNGLMFHPKAFEHIFLPAFRRMIRAYKEAGAKYVIFHSDGDIRSVLDMLVDAGIDGLNPLERRAGMHPVELRARYPRLVLIGGMCNTDTLIHGPAEKIVAEAREIIDLGRDGGVIIGTHSVSPEVPLENFALY
ncbi:MAG TPA: uroporphyrinogen decarboxylase family protein, partial [Chthonomonadales bacterium]|nr:uroporphyrinogen decarboxylase family protein [Chthonomonadales bacterium]